MRKKNGKWQVGEACDQHGKWQRWGEGGLLRDLGNGVSCLLQEGGCVGSRYASCRAREFIKSHQHAPGPCASAPSSAVHASLVRAGVFMCGLA